MADTSPPPRKIQVTQETLDKALHAYRWYISCPLWELDTDPIEKGICKFVFENMIEAIFDEEGNEITEQEEMNELTFDGQSLCLLDLNANKWQVVCGVL